MKKTIFYLLLILSQGLNAQEILKTTYHEKERNEEVSLKRSDYTRTVKSTPKEGVYSFEENWKDGTLKRQGFVSEYKPKFKQFGKEITYHKNGKISQIQFIKNGSSSIGKIQTFYENGKLKEEGRFTTSTSLLSLPRFDSPNYIAIQIADSLGHTFLDSTGSGKVSIKYANGNSIEGEYLNGLKNGHRKEFYAKDKELDIQEFENGKFLRGHFIDSLGKRTDYKGSTLPIFEGGIKEFHVFISRNLRYPPNMKKQKIEGRVTVNFMVEKDGAINNIRVLRGIPGGDELEQEAVRVIRMSPKWTPGTQRGKPVRVSYSVPINFALSYVN